MSVKTLIYTGLLAIFLFLGYTYYKKKKEQGGSSDNDGSGSSSSGNNSYQDPKEMDAEFPLKLGSKGRQVVFLQEYYNEFFPNAVKGLLDENLLQEDGIFGPNTELVTRAIYSKKYISETQYENYVAKLIL